MKHDPIPFPIWALAVTIIILIATIFWRFILSLLT
jgi:hypothetical protein